MSCLQENYTDYADDKGKCTQLLQQCANQHMSSFAMQVNSRSSADSNGLPRDVKINVDAAFAAEDGNATARFAVTDHLGSLILAASMTTSTCSDAEAEAKAILIGLELAILKLRVEENWLYTRY